MAEFEIHDADYASLKGQVVVLTGGASGIGLATAELLLSVGALVVAGDVRASPLQHANLTSTLTDVTSWPALLALFDAAVARHGRVDHVFANAGIGGRARYLAPATIDPATGALAEPPATAFDVLLRGTINTAYLGLHHMRRQSPPGGSVVCTASASSFQRFSATDYAAAKHAVLGFVRGITAELAAAADEEEGESEEGEQPRRRPSIRINAVAPSWTVTGIVPAAAAARALQPLQEPIVVARNVALFMADASRHGQLVYSVGGKYYEVEEAVLLPAAKSFIGEDTEEKGFRRMMAQARENSVE